jgi:4-hydroxybenzoyl-CoA reductase subunit beta
VSLPDFELVRTHSLEAALVALSGGGATARPLGGGTDLLVQLRQGLDAPARLVELTGVSELVATRPWTDGLAIGGAVRLADVAAHVVVRTFYPALAEAATAVASPPLRNSATLGGNLCLSPRCLFFNQSAFWRGSLGGCLRTGADLCRAAPGAARCFASFSADTPPALMVLNATVLLQRSCAGEIVTREIPVESLYRDDGLRPLRLEPGEVIVEVRLPGSPGLRSGYRKYRRRGAIDYPLAGVAAAFRVDDGILRDVRVATGALASAPALARETMALLEGCVPSEALLREAAELVARGTHPVKNQAGTPAHRLKMARVLCRRLLDELTRAA